MIDTDIYKSLIQKLLRKYNCPKGVDLYQKTVGETGLGFVYREGFAYGKVISNAIREVYQSEDMLKLSKVWELGSNAVCQSKQTAVQFEWHHFSGLMVVVGIMSAVGILLNMCEHYFVYWYGKNPFIDLSDKLSVERKERRKNTALISANRALGKRLNVAGCENSMNQGMFSFHDHNK